MDAVAKMSRLLWFRHFFPLCFDTLSSLIFRHNLFIHFHLIDFTVPVFYKDRIELFILTCHACWSDGRQFEENNHNWVDVESIPVVLRSGTLLYFLKSPECFQAPFQSHSQNTLLWALAIGLPSHIGPKFFFLFGSSFRPTRSIYVRPKLFWAWKKKEKKNLTQIQHTTCWEYPLLL